MMNKYLPTTLQKILNFFDLQDTIGITTLSQISGLSRTILHKYVKELVSQKKLTKIWSWSHTRYQIIDWKTKNTKSDHKDINIDREVRNKLDEVFLKYTPQWTILKWYDGILQWCKSRWLDPEDKIKSYIKISDHISSVRNKCGLLESTQAFAKTVWDCHIEKIYYADQYKRMDFGRGKLAEMTFYAKQSQNRKTLIQCIDMFVDKIKCLIQNSKIDAIAFVPATISRQWQLLKMIDTAMQDILLPRIQIKKFYEGNMKIPQKSLKKREDRIINAQKSIYVYDPHVSTYKNVLLIDDFVWSGATMNETAKKLKTEWIKKVIWFAIVWNMDMTYDIITEM